METLNREIWKINILLIKLIFINLDLYINESKQPQVRSRKVHFDCQAKHLE